MTETADPGRYAHPVLECDIVMKGGITSGVIYPQAVAELARVYRLRSVGGSSAGAIAAAAAAAAEVGRDAGGFERLNDLPRALTEASPDGASRLASLFQPTRTAAPLYRVLTVAGAKKGWIAVVVTLLRGYWLAALVGALLGIIVVVISGLGTGIAQVSGIVAGVLLVVLGVVVGIAWGATRTLGAMAADGFGACTGMPADGKARTPALTPWLYEELQAMAGLGDGAPPLTFGVLDDHEVTLRMMTTNLTRHEPTAMPWRTHDFYFDPVEFRQLFPEDVVAWMETHPPTLPTTPSDAFATRCTRAAAGRLRPWPNARDLPVIVATRMSLSFPGLITAVRLYGVDYTEPANRDARTALTNWRQEHPDGTVEQALAEASRPTFSPVWFSDGGLCSNLPVHFFDSPLPTRPSFAMNLAPFPPGQEKDDDESRNSYLPHRNAGGQLRPWFSLRAEGVGGWMSFAGQLIQTARTWVDAGQLTMPGYRDRIVTVHHTKTEGGMNLNMPGPVVTALSERGRHGAAKLLTAFAGEAPGEESAPGWENHRWIRFRTATAGLHSWLALFANGYHQLPGAGTPYESMAGENATAELPSYKPSSAAARKLLNERTKSLVDLADTWIADDTPAAAAPRPRPRLRLVPDDGTAAGLGAAPGAAVIDALAVPSRPA